MALLRKDYCRVISSIRLTASGAGGVHRGLSNGTCRGRCISFPSTWNYGRHQEMLPTSSTVDALSVLLVSFLMQAYSPCLGCRHALQIRDFRHHFAPTIWVVHSAVGMRDSLGRQLRTH